LYHGSNSSCAVGELQAALANKALLSVGQRAVSPCLAVCFQIGTPYYLSPEICQDKPYNRKSDCWGLGEEPRTLVASLLPNRF
jgi:serine/threonine protein kinase